MRKMVEHMQFHLPDYVSVCLAGKHCVFLDLRRDEYSCLRRCDTVGFAAMVDGWPDEGRAEDRQSPVGAEDLAASLNALAEAGLLAPNGECGRNKQLAPIPTPSTSLLGGPETDLARAAVRPIDTGRFLTAIMSAALVLRRSHMETLVRKVDRRRKENGRGDSQADLPKARELTFRFRAMRPWVPLGYRCLFDSLALLKFLARYGVFPTWVFGVRTAPFGAHCWVQAGEVVLNDTVEQVRPFTPIMAV